MCTYLRIDDWVNIMKNNCNNMAMRLRGTEPMRVYEAGIGCEAERVSLRVSVLFGW